MRNQIEDATSVSDITSEDIIDSRDLESLRDRLQSKADDYAESKNTEEPTEQLTGDEEELLATLTALADEVSEWNDGAMLIRETHFKDYAMELADEIGAIDPNAGWPLQHIDWDAAAESLQQDYSASTIGGMDYYWRS